VGADEADMSPRAAMCGIALCGLIAALVGVSAGAETTPSAALTPEETVRRYLAALQAGDFPAAYDCLSAGMVQHKSREAWAKEAQWMAQMSDTKIFEFHVYPGKIEGDKAQVPDLLSSQDKFLNQLGLPEHELYTLIREQGRWKIDQQQLLERSEQSKWFPAQEK
jgi:hypothetical protein